MMVLFSPWNKGKKKPKAKESEDRPRDESGEKTDPDKSERPPSPRK